MKKYILGVLVLCFLMTMAGASAAPTELKSPAYQVVYIDMNVNQIYNLGSFEGWETLEIDFDDKYFELCVTGNEDISFKALKSGGSLILLKGVKNGVETYIAYRFNIT